MTSLDFRDNYLIKLKPVSASLSDAENPTLSLFPNPVSGVAQLRVSTELHGERFVVTDNSGRIIQSGKLEGQTQTLEFSALTAGTYQLLIKGLTLRFMKY